jgi:hypothetical protein
MCKAVGIETTEKSHTHRPVCENEDMTTLWYQVVNTEREIMAN